MAHTLTGAVNGIDVTVRGIIDVPLPSLSKRLVYLHLAQRKNELCVCKQQ